MRNLLLCMLVLGALVVGGCSGTGFDKRATLVPDSVTVGWAQETYRG